MHLFNWLKPKKSFRCGGECCIEFSGGGRYSKIWYRQPTGDEQLNYAHSVLSNEKTELRKIGNETINTYTMQKMTREKKFIPFAKKIITRWEGYCDENGKKVKDISFLEKFFPHHLDIVAIRGYEVNDNHKKKD